MFQQMSLENFDFSPGPGLPPVYAPPAGVSYKFNPQSDFGPAPIFMKLKAGESDASFEARLQAGLNWIKTKRAEETTLRRELLAEEMTNPKEINFSELGFSNAEWLEDGSSNIEDDYIAIANESADLWDDEIELVGVEGELEVEDEESDC